MSRIQAELLALPRSNPRRDRVLQLLTSWRVKLELNELDLSNHEEGTLMVALSQVFLEWEETRIQQGIQQGIERERSLILRQLKRRVGDLPERMVLPINQLNLIQLELLGEALLDFTATIDLMRWLLICRLGDLSEPVLSRVSQLAPAQLEKLGEALLEFSDSANLDHWLDENPLDVADRSSSL